MASRRRVAPPARARPPTSTAASANPRCRDSTSHDPSEQRNINPDDGRTEAKVWPVRDDARNARETRIVSGADAIGHTATRARETGARRRTARAPRTARISIARETGARRRRGRSRAGGRRDRTITRGRDRIDDGRDADARRRDDAARAGRRDGAGCVDAVARHPLFRDRARPTFVAGDAPPRRGPAGGGRVYDCARSAARVGGWAPAWPSLDAFFAADAEKPSEVADRLP